MDINQDIQAVHDILTLFERSKSNSEVILDTMPGIFCIMDVDGFIFRGNKELARIMDMDQESLPGKSFKNLCSAHGWITVQEVMDRIFSRRSSKTPKAFEFEIIGNGQKCSYLIYLNPLYVDDKPSLRLLTVVGLDITDLKNLKHEKALKESEFETAKVLQENLLLPLYADFGRVKLNGHYQPGTEAGGDFWFYNCVDNKIFIFFGDIKGQGVPAALAVAAIRTLFSVDAFLLGRSPSELAALINTLLYKENRPQKSVAALIGCVDMAKKQFTFCNAGHLPPVLIIAPDDKTLSPVLRALEANPSPVLASSLDSVFHDQHVRFRSGDRLFFYTDGVLNLKSAQNEIFGKERLYNFLIDASNHFQYPEDFINDLIHILGRYKVKAQLGDDTTFFLMQTM